MTPPQVPPTPKGPYMGGGHIVCDTKYKGAEVRSGESNVPPSICPPLIGRSGGGGRSIRGVGNAPPPIGRFGVLKGPGTGQLEGGHVIPCLDFF